MNIERRKQRIQRRTLLAGEWEPRAASAPENALFDGSFELAESARALEQTAGTDGSGRAIAASLGCVTSAFDSLATAMLNLRGVALRELRDAEGDDSAERIARLLFAIDQNLRFASHAADLGRQAAAETMPPGQPVAADRDGVLVGAGHGLMGLAPDERREG